MRDTANALAIRPDHPFFLAQRLRFLPPKTWEDFQTQLDKLVSLSPPDATQLGLSMLKAKEYEGAKRIFAAIVNAHDHTPSAWHHLAVSYAV